MFSKVVQIGSDLLETGKIYGKGRVVMSVIADKPVWSVNEVRDKFSLDGKLPIPIVEDSLKDPFEIV